MGGGALLFHCIANQGSLTGARVSRLLPLALAAMRKPMKVSHLLVNARLDLAERWCSA